MSEVGHTSARTRPDCVDRVTGHPDYHYIEWNSITTTKAKKRAYTEIASASNSAHESSAHESSEESELSELSRSLSREPTPEVKPTVKPKVKDPKSNNKEAKRVKEQKPKKDSNVEVPKGDNKVPKTTTATPSLHAPLDLDTGDLDNVSILEETA
ncbi:hypothetical protein MYU51_002431 [Penicillium brevicompactum]|uniref:uncharacterized protein n=1 Tax=Penicillium brevicompactum TaxID=5074 RepID=UPI002540EAA8|nr:uncharacterized protein N7506_003589 [Penicillium brevicompactum]KAJ5343765.1 hypothetical protein N7506_003589 [Penicillium brevicompactum]